MIFLSLEMAGIEPGTLYLQNMCSPTELHLHDIYAHNQTDAYIPNLSWMQPQSEYHDREEREGALGFY